MLKLKYAANGIRLHTKQPPKFDKPKTVFVPYFCAKIPPGICVKKVINMNNNALLKTKKPNLSNPMCPKK
jgi:hypothetical protein